MEDIILKIDNLSKQYRLGIVGTGTLGHDINRAWHHIRGKEDPYLQIGAVNDRAAATNADYVWALKNINFEVKRGEILGIIGKNGAGKSTLLKILSRVTSPSTGSVKTKGRIASLLEVGTGMHPELTGRENMYLNGAILGMTKSEINSKIDEIVAFSGCQMYIDTPVKRYSSGMRVRLGFAVAAFLEPDILVVDEVLAVGDAAFQKKAIGKMQDISRSKNRTVLFVSHNLGTIKALTKRCILLKNGKIHRDGPTDAVVEEYTTMDGGDTSSFKFCGRVKKTGLQIIDVAFLTEKNKVAQTLVSGQTVKIKIEILNHTKRTYENCSVGLGIFDVTGSMLTAYKSDVTDTYYHMTPSRTTVYCVIDKLPLSAGMYNYNINVRDFGETHDALKNAGCIAVASGDFFSTGKLPASAHQTILVDQSWK